MRSDGTFVVLWTYNELEGDEVNDSVIQGRRFGADGSALGDAFQVNKLLLAEVSPLVAALPDGRFLALWRDLNQDGSLAGVYSRSFAAEGTPTSSDVLITDGAPDALAAGVGGNAVAAFQHPDGRIVAQVFKEP